MRTFWRSTAKTVNNNWEQWRMCSTSLVITRKANTQINQQHFKCATSKLTSAETTTTTTMTLRIPVVLLFFIFFSLFSGFFCEKHEALSFSNFLERRPLASFFYRYWSEDDDDEETKKNVHSTDDKPLVMVNTSSPAYRRQFIVNMTAEAWAAYREHAWGAELLRPLSPKTNFSGSILATSGGTIVASMSTLWVMGLKREFEQGRAWIASHLNMSAFRSDGDNDDDDNDGDGGDGSACSSQTTSTILVSHHIGSLLSCYALTGDDLFLKKATQIDGQLRPSPSQTSDRSGSGSWPWRRPPRSSSKSKNCKKRRRRSDRQSLLSEWAHQVLEYRYLSALTGDRRYRSRVTELEKKIRQKVEEEEKEGTLKKETDFGVKEDNHLMAKVKSFLQSNGRDEPSLEAFLRVFIHLLPNIRTFPELNVTYIVGQVPSPPSSSSSSSSSKPFHHHRRSSKYRHYRDCSLGAMFALAAKAAAIKSPPSTRNHTTTTIISHPIARYMADLADRLTESCHTVARQTATGLPPYAFYVEDQSSGSGSVNKKKEKRALTFPQPSSSRLRAYNLDPELAEAYFTLYRTTRREKWRQYAWELVQAIHRHCRVVMGNGNGAAYSALVDVTKAPPVKRDVQTPVFLGATLKYLYLTFLDDEDDAAENSLPLSSWLFNAVGQPLPIAGRNAAYLQ